MMPSISCWKPGLTPRSLWRSACEGSTPARGRSFLRSIGSGHRGAASLTISAPRSSRYSWAARSKQRVVLPSPWVPTKATLSRRRPRGASGRRADEADMVGCASRKGDPRQTHDWGVGGTGLQPRRVLTDTRKERRRRLCHPAGMFDVARNGVPPSEAHDGTLRNSEPTARTTSFSPLVARGAADGRDRVRRGDELDGHPRAAR